MWYSIYFGFRAGIVCGGDLVGLSGIRISAWGLRLRMMFF